MPFTKKIISGDGSTIGGDVINKINDRLDEVDSQLEQKTNDVDFDLLKEDYNPLINKFNGDLQSYIDSITDDSITNTIIIPKNFVYTGDLVVNKKNIIITGEGTIKGTIRITFDKVTHANIKIQNITIQQESNNKKNCVEIENTFQVFFKNIKFMYGNASIFFHDKGYKHSGYIKIVDCVFSYANYNVLLTNDVSNTNEYQVADLLLSNSHSYSTQISGIHCNGVDGFIITSNCFFFGSFAIQEINKTNNIYIKNSNFVIIQGNNLFESGAEAIKLEKYLNANISNNNIAWSGQRLKTPAIYLTGTTQGTLSEFVNTVVEGNNINCPCYCGIKIDSYVTGLNVSNNNIIFDSSNTYYYGEEVIELSERKSIITTNSVKEHCLFNGNMYPNSEDNIYTPTGLVKGTRIRNNFSKYGLVNKGVTAYSVNSSSEEQNVNFSDSTLRGYDYIVLQGSNEITLTNFGTDSSFDYATITVISYASNVTIVNGSGIRLKDASKNTMTGNTMRRFHYYAGTWFEI